MSDLLVNNMNTIEYLFENESTSSNYTILTDRTSSLDNLIPSLYQTASISSNYSNFDNYYNCDPMKEDFNCTVEEYLKHARGPQQLPLLTALLVTILFVGIFVSGIVGNVIVCVVIVKHPTMHTATNYYLFSLAVSDLILLLMGLPYEISIYWHQYPYSMGLAFCKIRAYLSEASTYVSVLTIVAFSMERFLAICHPLHLYTMSGFKRALRIIAALWIISFISAVPFAVYTKIDFLRYPLDGSIILDSAFCATLEIPPDFPLWELSSCVFFVIPMALIMVLYGRMGCRIRSRTRHSVALGVQQGSMHRESRHQQSRKAIIRMLAAVVITFFVCWAPFHTQRLTFRYAQDWPHFQVINTWLFSVGGWFYYVSCTINPILYNVMSHRYRVAFKETLCGRKKGYLHNNGFARDQSSFRETTVGTTPTYENAHMVRVRSIRSSQHYKEREATKGNLRRNKTVNCNRQTIKEETTTNNLINQSTNVVVVMENNINGKPKVYTENDVQENLLKKDETYI